MSTLKEYLNNTHNAYGIDRTLLVERLRWSPTERLLAHEEVLKSIQELRMTIRKIPHDSVQKNPSNPHRRES